MLNASIAPASPLSAHPPAQTAANARASQNGPDEFARQLERANTRKAADAPDTAAPAPQAAKGDNGSRVKPRAEAERNKTDKTDKAPARAAASPSDDKAGTDPVRPLDEEDTTATPVATDAAVLLASLLNRAVPSAGAGRGGDTAAAAAAAATAQAVDTRRALAPADAAAPQGNGDGAAAAAALRAQDDTGPTLNPQATDNAVFALPQAAAQAAQGAHNIAAPDVASTAPAPYASQIAAPVGSPDFAPGLSAQVSVMVREGLQEARLQLNPAEMGPITVQIQIDGGTAQVTMTAEQALTRDALEQAMPMLAGALREEGLTLTGGGVFEQARQAPEDAAPAGRQGGGNRSDGDDGDAAVAAPASRAAPRGMVDLVA